MNTPPPDDSQPLPAAPDSAAADMAAHTSQSGGDQPRRVPMLRQYELVERVKAYDPSCNEDALNRAYVFALKAHGNQKRASGDPYFSHPLEVAGLLTEMRMDTATIITALLHDTVEDTTATLEDVEKLFGGEIARLVDGVTKLSRIEFQNEQAQQAENFRKLVLAMSEDIRVLLVKLADRLHNMRTLRYVKNPDKRRRKARETMDIYAPLAQRIGIQQMQEELEDLSFAELNPDARDSIKVRLEFLRAEGGDLTSKIVSELHDLMAQQGLPEAAIYGREKTAYSIWRKMQRHNIAFEQLSDIMAFRIIVDSVEQCYQALGIIHSRYHVVPGRFKDYISTPKPNGYQSLHTGIIGPEKQRIEIQIRTRKMHDVSELGVAAHWDYKQGISASGGTADKHQYRWLRELLDIVEQAQKPEEFLEHTKLELFQDQVFCFTPKGDLIVLPRGATPVDFAYAVHSRVGDTCVGAKINGRMVPLRTALRNGDQVDITTARNQTPSPAWERFVVTGKARARIRKFVRMQQKTEYAALGKSMLQKVFQQENIEFSEKLLEPVLKQFQSATLEDLYANVGANLQNARDILGVAAPVVRSRLTEKQQLDRQGLAAAKSLMPAGGSKQAAAAPKGNSGPLAIRGLIPGMAVHYARCCHPLPGDAIVGIVTTGKGVTIHTQDCETLSSFAAMPERWIDIAWDDHSPQQSAPHTLARIKLVLANEPGSLGGLSTIIGKQGGNIANLKITSRSSDFYDMLIDVQVKDLDHLGSVMAALRSMSAVHSVERTKGR